jgi:hypothetical protein
LNSAKTLGAQQLIVHCDSLLVASQINVEYMARDERMAAYLLKVQQTMTGFQTVRVEQIGRNLNSHADALATLASVLSADFKRFIPIETFATPSIAVPACHIHTITVGPCWMDPNVYYLKEGVLPEQKRELRLSEGKRYDSGYQKIQNSTSDPFQDPIFCASIPTSLRTYYTRYMKASVEVTQGEDLWHTEPLPKDIGGPTCRRML